MVGGAVCGGAGRTSVAERLPNALAGFPLGRDGASGRLRYIKILLLDLQENSGNLLKGSLGLREKLNAAIVKPDWFVNVRKNELIFLT